MLFRFGAGNVILVKRLNYKRAIQSPMFLPLGIQDDRLGKMSLSVSIGRFLFFPLNKLRLARTFTTHPPSQDMHQVTPVANITKRSKPTPNPACGTEPYRPGPKSAQHWKTCKYWTLAKPFTGKSKISTSIALTIKMPA